LTSRNSETESRTTGRFRTKVVPIDPYRPTEFELFSCSGSGNNRLRILERSDLQTGSGRGLTDFRSLSEVGLDDLQMSSKSQVAGSNRFRDTAILVFDFLYLPATGSGSSIAESYIALEFLYNNSSTIDNDNNCNAILYV